jgi:hypothetical protein
MLTHVRFGYQTVFQHAEAGIFVTPMFNFMSFFRNGFIFGRRSDSRLLLTMSSFQDEKVVSSVAVGAPDKT